MADDRILIQLEVVQKGNKLSVVAKDTEKLGRASEKTAKSSEKLEKQSKKTYGRFEQGTIGTANATKSFSKLNQTIGGGGSGGAGALVGAYAVLAANIFAVTAAFGALSRAAAVEKLSEGLETFSNQTGQSLDLVARKLKEATGNAVSLEQAMTTAAVATSAGFGVTEMEGLTEVARNASLALGRDMGDALDRLTRGAIKLEPEILDELGIMVRLDDATENFAATLGKAAGNLTRFERQQAFVNAIITEGRDKFSALAEVDPNPYDQLSAAFADLTKNILSFINVPLKGLVSALLSSPGLFLGAVTIFSGGIIKRMIPAFGDMAQSAKDAAAAARNSIQGAIDAGAGAQQAIAETIKPNKEGLKTFDAIFGKMRQGKATADELKSANRSLGQRIGQLTREQKEYEKVNGRSNAQLSRRINLLKTTQQEIRNLQNAEVSAQATRALEISEANLAFADAQIGVIAEAQRQTFGYADRLKQLKNVFKGISSASRAYFTELVRINFETGIAGIKNMKLSQVLAFVRTAFKTTGLAVKSFGLILLNSIPILGQVFFAFTILKDIGGFFARVLGFVTDESEAANRALEDLDGVLSDVPKKMEALAESQKRASVNTKVLTAEFRVLGGLFKTVGDEAIKTQAALNAAGQGPEGFSKTGFFERQLSNLGRGLIGRQMINFEAFDIDQFLEADAFAASLTTLEKNSTRVSGAIQDLTGGSLREFIDGMIDAKISGVDMSIRIGQLFETLETRFIGLAEAVDGVSTGLKEAEKEVGKFMRSTEESTKFDQVFSNVSSIQRELNEVRKQAEEGQVDLATAIGEATQDIGTNMRILLGPEALAAGKTLNNEKQKLNKLIEKGKLLTGQALKDNVEEIALQKEVIKEQQKKQGAIIDRELPGVIAILDSLRQQEITQKALTKDVQQRIKLIDKLGKGESRVLATQALNNVITQEQIRGKKLLLQLNDGAIKRAKGLTDEELRADGVAKAALELEKSLLQEIQTLENQIADDTILKAEAALAAVKDQENLNKLIREEEKIRNNIRNLTEETKDITFAQQGIETDKLTARTALRNLEIAKEKFDLAEKERDTRMAILKAENEVFKANSKIQQAQTQVKLNELRAEKKARDESLARQEELTKKETKATFALPGGRRLLDRDVNRNIFSVEEENELRELREQNKDLNLSNINEELSAYEMLFKALKDGYSATEQQFNQSSKNNLATAQKNAAELTKAYSKFFGDLGENLLTQTDGGAIFGKAMEMLFSPDAFQKRFDELMESMKSKLAATLVTIGERFAQFGALMQSVFGAEGAGIVAISQFMSSVTVGFGEIAAVLESVETTGQMTVENIAGIMGAASTMLAGVSAAMDGYNKSRIDAIDKEIEAEKKKDGKSRESLMKIHKMEMQKEAMARKNFEQQKKMNIALTIMNTAVAAMGAFAALTPLGPAGPALAAAAAAAIAAIGAVQVAIISKQQYSGFVAGDAPSFATDVGALSVGNRTNEVNVAQTASKGELAYLRGEAGRGDISNFRPAASGRRGYAVGSEGVVVGERGPEVITPSMPIDITPNDQIQQTATNVNFTIHAVDAAGLEQTIQSQRGNIIGMIREAANGYGENFLEQVDIDTLDTTGGSY